MGFSKLKDYVKSGYLSARESVQKKIHDQKKKAALEVLTEMGMRANVSRKEEEKIVNPAYNLVFAKYYLGGNVDSKDYVVVGIPDLKKLTTITKLEFVLDNKFYEIKDVNEDFLITDKGNIGWKSVSDRKFPDENGMMIAYGEKLDNFFMFKLTDEERAKHPYNNNNWMHAKADLEDAFRDKEDSMMRNGGAVGVEYRLMPYKDMSVPNMIEPIYDMAQNFTGTLDGAIKKAQDIFDSNAMVVQVNVNKSKTKKGSGKVAVVSAKGATKTTFESGGAVAGNKALQKWDVVNEQVKFAVVRAVGFDEAMRYAKQDFVVSPYRLLGSAVYKDMLDVKEINKFVFLSALIEAESIESTYRDSGEGIGSSDMNHFIKSFLDYANLKTAWINHSLQRVDANGEVMVIKNDLPSSTMFKDGGAVQGGADGWDYVVRGNDGDFLNAGYDIEDFRLYSFGSDHTRASLFTKENAEWITKAINNNQPQFENTVIFNSKPYIQKYSDVINNAPLIKKFFWWW